MPAEDIWQRIDTDIVTQIRSLDLTAPDEADAIGDRVDDQMWPDLRDGLPYPRVLVTHEGEVESLVSKTGGRPGNRVYVWRRPSRVWIVDSSENRLAKKGLYLSWRWLLINHFMNTGTWATDWPNVPELSGVAVVPEIVFDERLPLYQHCMTGIRLDVTTTETG